MRRNTSLEVTVKCRIGVDEMDEYDGLNSFINVVEEAGIQHFIIHARKAWLEGLSPKQNREVPPLNYQRVYDLKSENPNLKITINGGIETVSQINTHLRHVDGVMIGRAAYQNPYMLSSVDELYYEGQSSPKSRLEVATAMVPYIEQELAKGTRLHQITRHMLGLFKGEPGARAFRQTLSEKGTNRGANLETYQQALDCIKEAAQANLATA